MCYVELEGNLINSTCTLVTRKIIIANKQQITIWHIIFIQITWGLIFFSIQTPNDNLIAIWSLSSKCLVNPKFISVIALTTTSHSTSIKQQDTQAQHHTHQTEQKYQKQHKAGTVQANSYEPRHSRRGCNCQQGNKATSKLPGKSTTQQASTTLQKLDTTTNRVIKQKIRWFTRFWCLTLKVDSKAVNQNFTEQRKVRATREALGCRWERDGRRVV